MCYNDYGQYSKIKISVVFIVEKHKVCSFFGHRRIEETEELKIRLRSVVINLIENEKVKIFLFGSRSEFNSLCHAVVSEIKGKYPDIQRRAYTCRNETCVLENERACWEKIYSRLEKYHIGLFCVEEVEYKTKWTSGKAQYVERNQAMIDDSDFCIFYYNKNYLTQTKTNSGTKIAYEYALRKNKKVINFFD